jgi:hypothetical protein
MKKHLIGEGGGRLPLFIAILCLVCAAVFFGKVENGRLARYMTLSYGAIAACGIVICRSSLPLGLCFIWAAIVAWAHPSTPMLFALSVQVYAMALAVLAWKHIPRERLLDAICVITLLNVVWQFIQLVRWVPWLASSTPGRQTLAGLQFNVEETGTFLAICLPAFFRAKWVWLLPAWVAGAAMTENLVAFVTGGAIGMIEATRRLRKRYWVPVALGICAAVLAYAAVADPTVWTRQSEGRIAVWKDSVRVSLMKPLGWGYGQYSMAIPLLTAPGRLVPFTRRAMYGEIEDKETFNQAALAISNGDLKSLLTRPVPWEVFLEAHNEYVEILFGAGLPGLGLLLWALVDLSLKAWRRRDFIPLCGLWASCITATMFFTWQIVPSAAMTVVWAGLILRTATGPDKSNIWEGS